MSNINILLNSLSIILLSLCMFHLRCDVNELERKPVMIAKELILTIKSMNDFERTEFGQALRDCGVAVVLTRKLGVATQEKGGDPTQDEINRVNAYHARQIDSLSRVKVPPIKSVKDYDSLKKGSPVEE